MFNYSKKIASLMIVLSLINAIAGYYLSGNLVIFSAILILTYILQVVLIIALDKFKTDNISR